MAGFQAHICKFHHSMTSQSASFLDTCFFGTPRLRQEHIDSPGGQVYSGPQFPNVARHVAQLQAGGREQFLFARHGGVVHSLGQAPPAQATHAVDLDGDQGGEALPHAAVVGDDGEDVVVGALVVQGFRVPGGKKAIVIHS